MDRDTWIDIDSKRDNSMYTCRQRDRNNKEIEREIGIYRDKDIERDRYRNKDIEVDGYREVDIGI